MRAPHLVNLTVLNLRRFELGITQAALARRVGVTRGHIAMIETGRRSPGQELAGKIAAEITLDFDEVWMVVDGKFESVAIEPPWGVRAFK